MATRGIDGPATVYFKNGDRVDVPSGEYRSYTVEMIDRVDQRGMHGASTAQRTERLNKLGREWRETIVSTDWVFVDFTAPATAYIHALEAEVERVGIVIERSVE